MDVKKMEYWGSSRVVPTVRHNLAGEFNNVKFPSRKCEMEKTPDVCSYIRKNRGGTTNG